MLSDRLKASPSVAILHLIRVAGFSEFTIDSRNPKRFYSGPLDVVLGRYTYIFDIRRVGYFQMTKNQILFHKSWSLSQCYLSLEEGYFQFFKWLKYAN